MTNYTKNIYYGLCSITSNYEFFIDNSPPTICPYHGGSITGIPIVSDTGKIYKIQIINNNFTNFNSSSYSKVLVLSLKGIRDSVLREINLIDITEKYLHPLLKKRIKPNNNATTIIADHFI